MQWRMVSGFTSIEVALVLGVLAILVAVALPWYRDYTLRARVAELIHAASACKAMVAEYYAYNNRWPSSAKEAGCAERVTASANPLAVFNGEIIVQAVGGLAGQLGTRNLFAFRAVCGGDACNGAPIQEWVCSASGEVAASTTIPARYLPSSCR